MNLFKAIGHSNFFITYKKGRRRQGFWKNSWRQSILLLNWRGQKVYLKCVRSIFKETGECLELRFNYSTKKAKRFKDNLEP